jgi:pimeloyl-ACP methyl ester carboxylesterase
MGGYVSLAFAEKYPDKLIGLVLFHSQAAADDEEGKHKRDRTIEVVKSNHKDFISAFIPLLFAEENVRKFEKEIMHLKMLSEQTSVDGICAALAGMRDRDDHLQLLRSIQFPVFFIVGKQDSRIAMEKIMPQLALPRNCEALILDDIGHMGFIEAKDITTQAIVHFAERMNEKNAEEK